MPRATGSLMRSHSTAGVPIPLSHPFTPPIPEGALLLTGATGFVGMEVLARLLERSDRHVVALIRAEDDDRAAERLAKLLEEKQFVVSVEIDEAVTGRARGALLRAGLHPRAVHGDGGDGWPPHCAGGAPALGGG